MIIDHEINLKEYLNKSIYCKMPDHTKKQFHEAWRHDPEITIKKIKTELGMAEVNYYKELDRLGVAYPKRTRKARKKDQEKKLKSCCEISFEGIYEPRQLLDQIDRLKAAINPGSLLYDFSIKIKELAE